MVVTGVAEVEDGAEDTALGFDASLEGDSCRAAVVELRAQANWSRSADEGADFEAVSNTEAGADLNRPWP